MSHRARITVVAGLLVVGGFWAVRAAPREDAKTKGGQAAIASAKPVPAMQSLPLPRGQASLCRDGKELTRYYFAADQKRPFLYPILGPAGRSLTRMGHPHDPVTHSHHNSVWVSHHDVNGENFWADHVAGGGGRIVHQRILRYEDGADEAAVTSLNHWVDKSGKALLAERRRSAARPVLGGQWLAVLDFQFTPAGKEAVTLNKTPFGLIGVRMAKTIGIHDGGGAIRNSEGNVGEQGPGGCFRKRARWVDYSGPIAAGAIEGITLLDHPGNPNHPTHFHVRGDGWMGAALTYEKAITLQPGQWLRVRYGLFVHAGAPAAKAIDAQWKAFAEEKIPELKARR